jgi:hypothetical protein
MDTSQKDLDEERLHQIIVCTQIEGAQDLRAGIERGQFSACVAKAHRRVARAGVSRHRSADRPAMPLDKIAAIATEAEREWPNAIVIDAGE